MIRYTNARYQNESGTVISVLIDGVPHSVPAVAGNAEYGDMVRDSIPIAAYQAPTPSYLDLRSKEYGTAKEQIEYAVENGMDALIARNLAIKEKYPKA